MPGYRRILVTVASERGTRKKRLSASTHSLDLECTQTFTVIPMNPNLTISQLSRRLDLSPHTIRYYERIGLFDAVVRAGNGHRVYAEKDVLWAEFLLRLKATGMPIQQMLCYAELRRLGDATLAQRRALLERHRQDVEAQIRELSQSLDVLDNKIQIYHQLEQKGHHHDP